MATSQNGYKALLNMLDRRKINYSYVPMTKIKLGCLRGDVDVVLKHVASQYHLRVERLNEGYKGVDDWSFAVRAIRGQTHGYSNHASGTAIDLNSTQHPLGTSVSHSFSKKQIAEIHKILREMDNVVRFGGFYSGRPDPMHWEINASPAAVKRVAAKIKGGPSVAPLVEHSEGKWFHVDPAQVQTGLVWFSPSWNKRGERKPNFNVKVFGYVQHEGRRWAVTERGNRYAASFLKAGRAS